MPDNYHATPVPLDHTIHAARAEEGDGCTRLCLEITLKQGSPISVAPVNHGGGTFPAPLPANGSGTAPSKKRRQPRRFQDAIDKDIQDYLTEWFVTYHSLRIKIRLGDKKAVKEGLKIFGRNVVAKAVGCGTGTVSNSKIWQKAADELGIRVPRAHNFARKRVGIESALDEAAIETYRLDRSELTSDKQAEIIDILAQIRATCPELLQGHGEALRGLLQKMAEGCLNRDAFWAIVQLMNEQDTDRRSSTLYSSP